MANLVVHFEIHATEPQRLIDFYSELFGWTFTQFGDVPYWSIDTGEGAIGMAAPGHGINGGLTQRRGPAPERGDPVNGLQLGRRCRRQRRRGLREGSGLGGSEALPLEDMQGIGRVGYLLDPDGNVFGLISPVLSDGTDQMAAERPTARSPRDRHRRLAWAAARPPLHDAALAIGPRLIEDGPMGRRARE